MLHPSYTELMDAVNSEVKEGEKPIVSSRYSIVIATAKRARQLIAGATSEVENYQEKKPVSVAVEELMNGYVKIITGGDDAEDGDDGKSTVSADVYDISLEADDEEIFEDELADEADGESEEAEVEDDMISDDEEITEETDDAMDSEEDDYE